MFGRYFGARYFGRAFFAWKPLERVVGVLDGWLMVARRRFGG